MRSAIARFVCLCVGNSCHLRLRFGSDGVLACLYRSRSKMEEETETGNGNGNDQDVHARLTRGVGDEKKELGDNTRVFKTRWAMLGLFILYSMSNSYQWIHLNIIADVVLVYWNESLPDGGSSAAFAVDWLSMVYMLVYVPLIVPASCFLNRFGLRYSAALGAALNAAGAWLKCVALAPDRFPVLIAGQTLCATAQLFVLNMPPKLAAVWFGPDELGTATSLGVFGNQVGCAIGFLIPPLLAQVNLDLAVVHRGLAMLLYSTAVVTTVVFILISIFMRAAPPVPPNRAQLAKLEKEAQMSAVSSFKRLFCNSPFVVLAISYGINAGCYYALGTLLYAFITAYFPGANAEAGQIGLTLVLAGVLGSVVVGIWLDRTKRFKQTTVAIYILTLICLASFTGFLEVRLIWLMFVIAFLLGLFMTGYLPVGFEFAVEITYPEPEGSSSGILNALAQVFGIVLTISERVLLESNERYGTLYANVLGCSVLSVGVVMTLLVKTDLKRQRALNNNDNTNTRSNGAQVAVVALLDTPNGYSDEQPRVFTIES